MEYHHPGVGTIVQPTWWVQCTHVHVGQVIQILQVMGITTVEGMGKEWRGWGGEEVGKSGGGDGGEGWVGGGGAICVTRNVQRRIMKVH